MKKTKSHQPRRRPMATFAWIASILVIASTIALTYTTNWHIGINYLLAINTVTFLLWGYDKAISSSRLTRIPERILHTLALAGGSPGALAGAQTFRHKTAKTSFQITYWLIVAIQVGAIYLIFYYF